MCHDTTHYYAYKESEQKIAARGNIFFEQNRLDRTAFHMYTAQNVFVRKWIKLLPIEKGEILREKKLHKFIQLSIFRAHSKFSGCIVFVCTV